jgi:hypothetical protein
MCIGGHQGIAAVFERAQRPAKLAGKRESSTGSQINVVKGTS